MYFLDLFDVPFVKRYLELLETHYVYKHSVLHFRGVETPSYSLGKHGISHTVKYPIRTLIKHVVSWSFERSFREKVHEMIGKPLRL